MSIWVPRDYQQALRDFKIARPRVNWWAGTGTGKTTSAIYTYDLMRMFDEVEHVLVVTTKRIATMVWHREVQRWENFSHLTCAVAVGKPDQRVAAIKRRAHITTINVDNLPWLCEVAGDEWYWDMVIADESSKLKGLRISLMKHPKTGTEFYRVGGGSKRAAEIARVAHKRVRHWINATATPMSNGLTDLWAQAWFLDAGQRLGRSFTAFERRWFRSIRVDQYQSILEPYDHSEAEIKALLSDITITIEAKDYMDLPPTVVNRVAVTLPPAAYVKYREMERECFTEIENNEIEAFNAGAKSMKLRQMCLAAGTEVLTSRGWVAIEDVTCDDLVWDGIDFVRCDGAVFQGVKDVVDLDGVQMTADHSVMTILGWRTAKEILDADASSGFERPSVWLPDGRLSRGVTKEEGHLEAALCLRQRGRAAESVFARQAGAQHRAQLRLQTRREVASSRHEQHATVRDLVKHEASLPESTRQGLSQLRCSWHNRLQALAEVVRELLVRYVGRLRSTSDTRTCQQQSRLLKSKLPLGDDRRAVRESQDEPFDRHASRSPDGHTGRKHLRSEACDAVRAPESLRMVSSTGSRSVYDLINCGPRNRYVVRGSDGRLLISHNCNGAAYLEGGEEWVPLHDAKIEALQDIVAGLGGEPILVAYYFRSDLERLRKAFPQGVYFDDKPSTLQRFCDGKIPVLFIHPKSAAHGIDGMQQACRHVAWFSMIWELEDFQQLIERVGATRQVQSGQYREVYVHLLIGENTIDEEMCDRIETKASVQDAFKAAMKKRGLK